MNGGHHFCHNCHTVCDKNSPPKAPLEVTKTQVVARKHISVRLQYRNKSILFSGDTLGRGIGDPEDRCIAAEKAMVDRSSIIQIDSDVMIAPHHGADNGSSRAFIEAVSPDCVIFSAGNLYSHPRQVVADRYLLSVDTSKIFRTDWRDKAEGPGEWSHDQINGTDQDDVDIVIRESGTIQVKYRKLD